MRKLLIAFLIFVSPVALAEFVYDAKTDRFSSKGASSKVDKEEYNALCHEFIQKYHPRGILDLEDNELAALFTALRLHGTAASLRFIHDAEKMIKAAKKDLKRIQNL